MAVGRGSATAGRRVGVAIAAGAGFGVIVAVGNGIGVAVGATVDAAATTLGGAAGGRVAVASGDAPINPAEAHPLNASTASRAISPNHVC